MVIIPKTDSKYFCQCVERKNIMCTCYIVELLRDKIFLLQKFSNLCMALSVKAQ